MIKIAIAAAIIALPVAAFAEGSPYLPIPGTGQVSVSFTDQSGDDFWVATTKMTLPAKIQQNNLSIKGLYALTDDLAIDGTLYFARSSFAAPTGFPLPHGDESALGDTTLGIKWRLVDEFEHQGAPTVSVRAGAIIKGNYSINKIDAINDGASGVEVSALVGKYLTPALSVTGEFGYRHRGSAVPSDWFGAANLNYSFSSLLSGSVGYSSVRSNGDLDIGGAGFTPARFQEVRENRDIVQVGLGYNLTQNISVGVNYGMVVKGRNTIKADIVGVSLSSSF